MKKRMRIAAAVMAAALSMTALAGCGKSETKADTVVSFYDETDVNVSPMTEKEIREYADSEEPMDKAGSYAVQGFFARYIDGLKGSYANVMGLPVHLVYQELKKLGAL